MGRAGTARRRGRVRFAGVRAAARTAACLLKVYPMLPSWPVDRLTPRPVVERVRYATSHGMAEGDLYRPGTAGPYPGMVVCLGVVPFGVEHPQVARLGEALARSGFAALLYWSPAMRDYRLAPEDVEDIASAYAALLARPDIDPARSGLLGTCVGGAFALMAAGSARIRERVGFVAAYAAYASMWTLARDIVSESRQRDGARSAWQVDPLTRKVFVHSITAYLEPEEAARLRAAFAEVEGERGGRQGQDGRRMSHGANLAGQGDKLSGGGNRLGEKSEGVGGQIEPRTLSEDGRRVLPLLRRLEVAAAEAALAGLPAALRARLDAMSPVRYLDDVRASLIVLLHDRDDGVIPVGESRALAAALRGRRGARYTEFTVFRHLDPTKGKVSPSALARQLARFAVAIYPVFRLALATGDGSRAVTLDSVQSMSKIT